MDTSDTFDFGLLDNTGTRFGLRDYVLDARTTFIDPAIAENVVTFLQAVETNPGDIGDIIGLVIDPAIETSISIDDFIFSIEQLPAPTAPPETSLTFSDDLLI